MSASQFEELQRLVQQALGRTRPRWHGDLVLLLLIAVISLVGSYAGAYLAERGRGQATDARFSTIIKQLEQTTRLTEDIRAQISSQVWVQQNRWSLKRDLYTRLLENLNEFRDATASHLFFLAELKKGQAEKKNEAAVRKVALDQLDRAERAITEIRRALSVAEMMLSQEAITALRALTRNWRQAEGLSDPGEGMRRQAEAAEAALRLLILAANKDLLGGAS